MAEVPDSLASVLGAAEEHSVGALRRPERQLVEGDALSASREDAGAGVLGEPEGAHYIVHVAGKALGGRVAGRLEFQVRMSHYHSRDRYGFSWLWHYLCLTNINPQREGVGPHEKEVVRKATALCEQRDGTSQHACCQSGLLCGA